MRIAIDMMGGDYAPKESCLGVLSFLSKFNDTHVVCIGHEQAIREGLGDAASRVTILHTEEEITMHDHPVKALKEKPNASMSIGFGLLAKGDVDAFVSAGNTGVMLVGAAHIIKLADGVMRPTIPTPVPQIDGSYNTMLDVGINADCKPEYLNQFATIGSVYVREIMDIEKPRVALLNIGEEEGKGNLLAQTAHGLMKENTHIHFVGNIEGRDLLISKADLVVTDGFTGNILLKFAESMYDVIKVQRNIQDEYLDRFNHRLYAGVPVLGVQKPLVVGHGVSDAVSFSGMLGMARKMIQSDICNKIATALKPTDEA